jgi:hypothetical protein
VLAGRPSPHSFQAVLSHSFRLLLGLPCLSDNKKTIPSGNKKQTSQGEN